METKELNFKGFKMNGFLGLFVHLIVLPALIFLALLRVYQRQLWLVFSVLSG